MYIYPMKNFIYILVLVSMLCILPVNVHSSIDTENTVDPQFARFTDSRFNYSLLIPKEWHKIDYDLTYKRLLILNKDSDTSIKISATQNNDETTIQWSQWKDWFLGESGILITKIIENKAFTRIKGLNGTLIIFEYKQGKQVYLQRLLLAQFKDTYLSIECRAPVKSFYNFAGIFDAAMSSLEVY